MLVLVGQDINLPFQHKNRLYPGQGLGWRFNPDRLRMAKYTVTSRPLCLFVQQRPNMENNRSGSFKLLY